MAAEAGTAAGVGEELRCPANFAIAKDALQPSPLLLPMPCGTGAATAAPTVVVSVPHGVGPGDLLEFSGPDGVAHRAPVPEGLAEGGQFTVQCRSPSGCVYSLPVPEDVYPGYVMRFTGWDGKERTARVPEGLAPGQHFTVQDVPSCTPQIAAMIVPQTYTVRVPEGAKAGQMVSFTTEEGVQRTAQVPEGMQSGESFQVRIAKPITQPRPAQPGVVRTAYWTAAFRALEHERPDRLFVDPLAKVLATPAEVEAQRRALESSMSQHPKSHNHIAVRCRCVDDLVLQQLQGWSQMPLVQVVSLGAGMCTRPWRLRLPRVAWLEVDTPDLLRGKVQLLSEQGAKLTVGQCRAIPVDFSDPSASLAESLMKNGFRRELPTVFIMEGLLYFLEVKDVKCIAKTAKEICTGDAHLILTCISEEYHRNLVEPSADTLQKFPGMSASCGLFKSSWEGGICRAFQEAGWQVSSLVTRDQGAERLGVHMLDYGFADPKKATEYLIVMKKKSFTVVDLLDQLSGKKGC